ncbi:MAG: hypothetical protein K9M84_12495 [Spirochaetia bacterium]|nr:hypothetical protein [Spirochaetia bacterium]
MTDHTVPVVRRTSDHLLYPHRSIPADLKAVMLPPDAVPAQQDRAS